MTAPNGIVLSVKDLTITYGNIKAVEGISFDVREGEIITLIGANGAGKSSTLRAISGMVPFKGQVIYRQKELRNVPPHRIVAMGIAQVPEGRGIFGNLTVMENLRLATWQRQNRKGQEGTVRGLQKSLRPLPAARAAEAPIGRDAFRGRTADACARSGHDEPREPDASG